MESEIDRKVFLLVGDSLEFNTIPMVQDKIDLAEKQYILNEYFHREIFLKYQASDSLIREAFRKSKINIHARHLFAPNIESANQLIALLEQGKTFEELAPGIFRDSTLASSGGDLGYFSIGDMDPAFEDAAFALADGEISRPVKTSRGYSIIQVIDRWVEPMISEQDFQLHKDDMNALLRSRNIHNRRQKWTDSLAQSLQIEISKNHLNLLFDNKTNIFQNECQLLKDTEIELRSKLGKWRINELVLRLNKLSIEQANMITSPEKLRESLFGILVKEKILQLAKMQDWYNHSETKWNIQRQKEDAQILFTIDYYLKDIKPRLKADYSGLLIKLREKVSIQIHADKVQELEILS
ncbi:uncharacterized protein METZ01_LOCUS235882 [marine metagenome]|uniref:PpiC domain-containing protein n=1 Tax=marine metagenome TaxID=408172 RepID=A0A382H6V0_9ZZZZ